MGAITPVFTQPKGVAPVYVHVKQVDASTDVALLTATAGKRWHITYIRGSTTAVAAAFTIEDTDGADLCTAYNTINMPWVLPYPVMLDAGKGLKFTNPGTGSVIITVIADLVPRASDT
jgi:hypothetical protein